MHYLCAMSKITIDDFLLTDEKDRNIINQLGLISYLTQEGYRRVQNGDYQDLVHIKDGVVSKISMANMHFYLQELIINKPHINKFIQSPHSFFSYAQISFLKPLEDNQLRDDGDRLLIPFKNGIIQITKDNVSLKPYSEVLSDECWMWEDRIIPKEITIGNSNGDFSKFVHNAVTEDGYPHAMRAIGYLIHNYKNASVAKIIAFVDVHDRTSTYANGGTGKSLIAKHAISQIRKGVFIDGKQFKQGDKFMFQSVEQGTEVVSIEDLAKTADLSAFFNAATGDFQTEKKFKSSEVIPFDKSPKICITANQGLPIRGTSEHRRICSIGFYNHYNDENTPVSEFGKMFFSTEWSEQDWNEFYNFMFACAQEYLNNGLTNFEMVSMQEKAMIQLYGDSLFASVKLNQALLMYPHKQDIVVEYFYRDFGKAYVRPREGYQAIRDIMDVFGYESKIVKRKTYTDWARPDKEEEMKHIAELKTRPLNIFVPKQKKERD